jgi:hypothetical protein
MNKIVNDVFRNVAHRIYQGVLYFQNGIQFHRTRVNIISIMPVRKVGTSLWKFSRNSQCPTALLADLLYRISPKMWKVRIEINLRPSVKYGFHGVDFHETHNKPINFYEYVLYWIQSKSDEDYRKCGPYFFYARKWSIPFTKPIFTKLKIT